MHLDDGFTPRALRRFERAFGGALLVEIATQAASGVLRVHTGELYPWRHLDLAPLAPPAVVVAEWLLVAACGAVLALTPSSARSARARTLAWGLLPPLLLFGLLQRFSNHGALFFLVALFTSMEPPDAERAGTRDRAGAGGTPRPNLGLVRAQLVVVYVFSALAKLLHGFLSGHSLANLLALPLAPARALSFAVVGGELALPFLVVWRPRLGIAALVVMHGAFALALPNVASFGLAMLAMALLWERDADRDDALRRRPGRAAPSPSPSDRAASDAPPPLPRT